QKRVIDQNGRSPSSTENSKIRCGMTGKTGSIELTRWLMASSLTTVLGELLAKRWEPQFGSPKTIPPGMVFYWMA
ncbi:hypothetical protein ACK3Z6_20355, partial [Aeromonas caviae]